MTTAHAATPVPREWLDRLEPRVKHAGQTLTLSYESSRPGVRVAHWSDLEVMVITDPRPAHHAARHVVRLQNRGAAQLTDLEVEPLHLSFVVDPDRDKPRVRHLCGSFHYDGVYPPRAFRVEEERFLTHDHCRPVRIESSTLGSAGLHVPILQLAFRGGEGLFAGFEYSSTWHLEAGWATMSFKGEPRPPLLLRGGVGLGRFTLAPGETLDLPALHVGWFEANGDAAVRAYVQDCAASRFQGSVPTPPVSYDHWFGLHERFDADDLMRQAECAAELGCEYFCLDAAWYACREQWQDGIGNWLTPDPRKFPRGIEPLSEHVRGLGMGFGLWHMLERATPGSDMLARHANCFHVDAKGRGYLRWDLPDARALALDLIQGWIERWQLTWMRWECLDVTSWTTGLDPSGKLAIRAVDGFYEVIDTIRRSYPDVYIEGCQGGGTKLDLGMTVRTHGAWLSDHTAHPDVCRFMQTGAQRCWPAHFLNSAVRVHRGSGDAEATSRNVLSRMTGPMSFNGDIAQWSPSARALARRHVDVFKSFRHLLHLPAKFPLPQPRGVEDWDVIQFGDELLFAFRMEGRASQRIEAPAGDWTRLLGPDDATLRAGELTMPPYSAGVWRKF